MPSSLPPEVFNQLCRAVLHLSPGDGLQTLASLARTSRVFHGPAASALWKSVPDLLVLIRTLPEDLWLETSHPSTVSGLPSWFKTQLSFKRPPVQSDFARLQHYAHRIRHTEHPNTCLIAPDVLNALATHFPAGTLLPDIRTLIHWCPMSIPFGPNQSLEVLFGPKLYNIELVCTYPYPEQANPKSDRTGYFDCIRALPSMCPSLSVLQVRTQYTPRHPLVTAVPEVITAFQDLTHVLVDDILLDFPTISHLAKLPNLEALNACLCDEMTQADIQSMTATSTNRPAYFPNLEKISLNHPSLSLPTSLLKVVSSHELKEVAFSTSMQFDFTCTSEDVSELCRELSRHTVLTHISVSVRSRVAGSQVTGAPFTQATFGPLIQLPNLTHLVLDIAHPLDIDDVFVAAMASAWRNLTKLSLCVARPRPGVPLGPFALRQTPTLFSLVSFVRWCPELEWLGLAVNTDLSGGPDELRLEKRPGGGSVLEKMVHMDVGMSVVCEPAPVAAFLSDLFPELETLQNQWMGARKEDMRPDTIGYTGWPGEIDQRWWDVSDLFDHFTAMRREEREWGATHCKGRDAQS